MKKWLFILFASTSFAVLPPLAESIKEIKALLSDPRFYESLGSAESIREIRRTDTGYLVLTDNQSMEIDIRYRGREGGRVGPAQFEFQFHPPASLQRSF